jgi:hypothetical protein
MLGGQWGLTDVVASPRFFKASSSREIFYPFQYDVKQLFYLIFFHG